MSLLTDSQKSERVAAPAAAPSDQGERTGDEKLDPLALVFLDNPLARRLAVAWQTCDGDEDLWLDVAGISRAESDDARRLCYALRKNGICRDGGVTASLALTYIQAIVAAPLTKAANKAQGGRRGRR